MTNSEFLDIQRRGAIRFLIRDWFARKLTADPMTSYLEGLAVDMMDPNRPEPPAPLAARCEPAPALPLHWDEYAAYDRRGGKMGYEEWLEAEASIPPCVDLPATDVASLLDVTTQTEQEEQVAVSLDSVTELVTDSPDEDIVRAYVGEMASDPGNPSREDVIESVCVQFGWERGRATVLVRRVFHERDKAVNAEIRSETYLSGLRRFQKGVGGNGHRKSDEETGADVVDGDETSGAEPDSAEIASDAGRPLPTPSVLADKRRTGWSPERRAAQAERLRNRHRAVVE